MTELEFHESRYAAVLKVMEGDRKRFNILEKEYKQLQSEYNVLKITHLNLLENTASDRIKDAQRYIKMNQKYIDDKQKLKDDYNKLLEREQNKGWNEL